MIISEGSTIPLYVRCRWCRDKMRLTWENPNRRQRGHIMSCSTCLSTCRADGNQTWDWRPGISVREVK